MLVKDLLEPEMVTVLPTDTISEAWTAMKTARTTGAVVVTEDGRIVGFLTDGDLIQACMPSETDLTIYDEIMENMELPDPFIRNLRSVRVEHAMIASEQVMEIITINHNEPVLKALALMFQHHLRRIPVLDENNLIGTISRSQVLSYLLVTQPLGKIIQTK